jgi:hypothetical protein
LEDLRHARRLLFEGLAPQRSRQGAIINGPIPGLAESLGNVNPTAAAWLYFSFASILFICVVAGRTDHGRDVVYSWLRALDPRTASEYAGQLFYVKNGEAYNSGKSKTRRRSACTRSTRHGARELNHPTAFFLDLCTFQTLAVVPRKAHREIRRGLDARPSVAHQRPLSVGDGG